MRHPVKNTRRDFVVEYKSNRRQPKQATKSIWDETDLHSISKAVAADMTPAIVTEPLKDRIVDQSPTVQQDKTLPSIPVAEGEPDLCKRSQQIETAAQKDVASVPEAKPVIKPKREQRHASTEIPLPLALETPVETSFSLSVVDDLDTLAALELENRRLKALLVKKLRAENTSLKDMLQQVESRQT